MLSKDLDEALEQIGKGRKIDKEVLVETLERALSSASKKILGAHYEIKVSFDEDTSQFKAFYTKSVVENVINPDYEISKEDVKKTGFDKEIGEKVEYPISIQKFGRIAAQTMKQSMSRKVRDIERDAIYNEFAEKVGSILNGVVLRMEKRNIIIDLGDTEGIIPIREQVFRENFQIGERIKVYVLESKKTLKIPQVILSRIHQNFIRKLFEMEIPEVAEKRVEIKGIARDPGFRIKIAVYSNDKNIDSVGACVGIKGGRIQPIVRDLKGEKIDVIEWDEDIETFIKNSLRPSKVIEISINKDDKSAVVIVSDEHLPLAIGRNGQNVRLVSRLTGWRIDIKGESVRKLEKEKEKEDNFTIIFDISEEISKVLKEGGFKTIEDLAGTNVKSLIKIEGVNDKLAKKIIKKSKNLISEKTNEEQKKSL
ncbi:MAG: transcription termination factor NusA [Candidatus Firestonebacteria bacterium]